MKLEKIILFFVLLALLMLTNFRSLNASLDPSTILEKIPVESKEDLNALFFDLINHDYFGYTLFGDKPVSIASFFEVTPWENTLELGECSGVMLKKWNLWKKYQGDFKINSYVLIEERSKEFLEIILINKKAFIDVVNKEINLFQSILRKKINPVEILADIEKGKTSFHDFTNSNNFLLGIMLGYGKQNAMLYDQRGKIFKNDCLNCFGDYEKLIIRISSIHFMADYNNNETKELEKKYRSLRGKLSAIYSNGDFFQTSINQLIK